MMEHMAAPLIVDFADPESWVLARDAIRAGLTIVLPTDTVYGIGADPFNPAAVQRLQAAKGRTDAFPPPVLLADADAAEGLVTAFPPAARRLAARFWPGPLTLILPAADADASLAATVGSLGLRVPDLTPARDFLRLTGPLAVSSANRHQSPAATKVSQAVEQLGQAVAVYLDGGPTPGSSPSSVVDFTGATMRILRDGRLSPEQIADAACGDCDA